ncbi:hypothetical protein SAY87_023838 [Trapa incisa]|uniref:EF-hand domain-containing protein n=1 Tax=Trapa incisa TaxID=236973 RepID=A0AAN7QRN9_9MYRT|nr:hypothetical protein SAY87_023838 [Trapa incisa]
MSNCGGITVIDGSNVRGAADVSLPDHFSSAITGAQVIELAESKVTGCLPGISFPESLKLPALESVGVSDAVSFSITEFDQERALQKIKDYISAIADRLDVDPLVVSILDGSTPRLYLEDEDDFAMLAENLFTDLDVEDKGKLKKKEIQTALDQMGMEMGIPPPSELPLLNDILKKNGAEGEEEVGQAQFAYILQPILQEIVDNLSKKPVVIVHNVKVASGARIRKLLENEKQLDDVTEKIWQYQHEVSGHQQVSTKSIRTYLEKFGKELGLPPPEVDESAPLYDLAFDVATKGEIGKDEFRELVKRILDSFAQQLNANPVFFEPEE